MWNSIWVSCYKMIVSDPPEFESQKIHRHIVLGNTVRELWELILLRTVVLQPRLVRQTYQWEHFSVKSSETETLLIWKPKNYDVSLHPKNQRPEIWSKTKKLWYNSKLKLLLPCTAYAFAPVKERGLGLVPPVMRESARDGFRQSSLAMWPPPIHPLVISTSSATMSYWPTRISMNMSWTLPRTLLI